MDVTTADLASLLSAALRYSSRLLCTNCLKSILPGWALQTLPRPYHTSCRDNDDEMNVVLGMRRFMDIAIFIILLLLLLLLSLLGVVEEMSSMQVVMEGKIRMGSIRAMLMTLSVVG